MKELDRLQVLTRTAERRLTRRRAAELLQMASVRCDASIARPSRTAPQGSCRAGAGVRARLPAATQERALALIRERYADFGSTSPARWARGPQSYPPRERRACLCELVQLEPGVLAAIVDMPPPGSRGRDGQGSPDD